MSFLKYLFIHVHVCVQKRQSGKRFSMEKQDDKTVIDLVPRDLKFVMLTSWPSSLCWFTNDSHNSRAGSFTDKPHNPSPPPKKRTEHVIFIYMLFLFL